MTYTWDSPLGRKDLDIHTEDMSLRPWDSADEYLLSQFEDFRSVRKILLINETFGALSTVMAKKKVINWNDSYSHSRNIRENRKKNGLDESEFTNSLDPFPLDIDLVILKIPRSQDYFSSLLKRISPRVPSNTPILAAGKSRLLPPSFFKAFEEHTESASYSRIWKKSRFYQGFLIPLLEDPIREAKSFQWENLTLTTLPGVYSHGKLDPGTRYLLENFPSIPEPETIADPGCGSGILSLAAASRWPGAKIISTDDSLLAVESTRLSAGENGFSNRIFPVQTDILEGVESWSIDLVICNPPFHHQNRVSVETGLRFIRESARVLRPGGRLVLVSNSHLGYGNTLRSLFRTVTLSAGDSRFSIHMCLL